MKKLFLVLLLIGLVSALIFGACAKPAPAPAPPPPSAPAPAPKPVSAPAPAPAPAPSPTPAPTPKPVSEKPIELKFASMSVPTHPFNTILHAQWIKKIEDETKGKVKITLYPGGALGKPTEAYDVAVKNIADISYGWIGLYPGRFKLTEIYNLAGLVADTKGAYHMWDVYNKYLQKEWSETKILWLGIALRFDLFTTNKQVRTCDDVKGMKIIIQNEAGAQAIKAPGGVPLEISATEAYMALQRGVADGTLNSWQSVAGNKLGELTRYYTKAGLMQNVFFCVMNLNAYNSLPPDIRKVIDDNSGQEAWQAAIDFHWNDDTGSEKTVMDQSGGKGVIYQLPPEEKAKFRKLVAPIYDKWVSEAASKGPAKEVFDMVSSYLPK